MSDSAAATVAPAAPTPKKKSKAGSAKKPKMAPSHPKVSEMVISAITSLKERGGSSLQAIKKHIASSHKVDIERLSPFIKKYLKSAVASGALVQTKGKGATGSFKLSGQKKEAAVASKPKAKKPATKKDASASKKTAKSAEKKKPTAKKPVEKKKAVKKAPAKKVSKVKTPKKAVKATKPKSPKPKKVKTPKKPTGKKTGKK